MQSQRTINIIGQVIEVDPPSRLVEHGTQHDMIGLNLSTRTRSTNNNGVIRTQSTSVICPIIFNYALAISLPVYCYSNVLHINN